MNVKIVGLLAALALLGACSENPATTTGAATGTGAQATTTGGAAPGSEEDLVANVGDRVFFAFDQTNLSDDARATLDRQAAWMARYPQVSVQSPAIATRAARRSTTSPSASAGPMRRATTWWPAASTPPRISTISYGKERPTALGDNEQAYAQNRNAITSVR